MRISALTEHILTLLNPTDHALVLIDFQSQMAFATKSIAPELLRNNAWEMTGLADPARPLVAPTLLAERGWTDLDYLKLDVQGAEYDILKGSQELLSGSLLGVEVEIEAAVFGRRPGVEQAQLRLQDGVENGAGAGGARLRRARGSRRRARPPR